MKNVLLAAILVIAFVACQQKDYTIDLTIDGVTEGQAILKKIEEGKPVSIDTAAIVEGKFIFTGSENEPQLYLIFINDSRSPIILFGENANITITAADVEKLDEAIITGSALNDILSELNKNIPEKERLKELDAEYKKASMTADKEKIEALKAEAKQLNEEQKAYFIQFIKNNTSNAVGANMAIQAAREFEAVEFKELASQFEANLGEHKYVTALKKMVTDMETAELRQKEAAEKMAAAEKATKIGAVAPDFTLTTNKDTQLSLSALKGKYVLVDFWASWCAPCRAENPNVAKAYKAYKAKGFDILSVSLDRDSAKWVKAIGNDGLVWNQVIDADGKIAKTYGVQSIPFTLLLDKEGKIIAKNLKGAALEEKLAELLN